MPRRKSPIATEARAFAIWREGSSVDWDCTVRELADATGISTSSVRYLCESRGWPVQPDERPGRKRANEPNVLWFPAPEQRHSDPIARLHDILQEQDEHDSDEVLTTT